jgi:hypothetical protein
MIPMYCHRLTTKIVTDWEAIVLTLMTPRVATGNRLNTCIIYMHILKNSPMMIIIPSHSATPMNFYRNKMIFAMERLADADAVIVLGTRSATSTNQTIIFIFSIHQSVREPTLNHKIGILFLGVASACPCT